MSKKIDKKLERFLKVVLERPTSYPAERYDYASEGVRFVNDLLSDFRAFCDFLDANGSLKDSKYCSKQLKGMWNRAIQNLKNRLSFAEIVVPTTRLGGKLVSTLWREYEEPKGHLTALDYRLLLANLEDFVSNWKDGTRERLEQVYGEDGSSEHLLFAPLSDVLCVIKELELDVQDFTTGIGRVVNDYYDQADAILNSDKLDTNLLSFIYSELYLFKMSHRMLFADQPSFYDYFMLGEGLIPISFEIDYETYYKNRVADEILKPIDVWSTINHVDISMCTKDGVLSDTMRFHNDKEASAKSFKICRDAFFAKLSDPEYGKYIDMKNISMFEMLDICEDMVCDMDMFAAVRKMQSVDRSYAYFLAARIGRILGSDRVSYSVNGRRITDFDTVDIDLIADRILDGYLSDYQRLVREKRSANARVCEAALRLSYDRMREGRFEIGEAIPFDEAMGLHEKFFVNDNVIPPHVVGYVNFALQSEARHILDKYPTLEPISAFIVRANALNEYVLAKQNNEDFGIYKNIKLLYNDDSMRMISTLMTLESEIKQHTDAISRAIDLARFNMGAPIKTQKLFMRDEEECLIE